MEEETDLWGRGEDEGESVLGGKGGLGEEERESNSAAISGLFKVMVCKVSFDL